ncbi:MAG: SRPBCC family protein [Terriglobales bacterium]
MESVLGETHMTITEEITIHAPATRVFDALADATQRRQWWGGERFKLTAMENDLRVGGHWAMHFDAFGRTSSMAGTYRIIDRPHVLEFTWKPDWYENPSESVVRFDLREDDGATHVVLTHSGLETDADRANHRGWPDILVWLRAHAEGN